MQISEKIEVTFHQDNSVSFNIDGNEMSHVTDSKLIGACKSVVFIAKDCKRTGADVMQALMGSADYQILLDAFGATATVNNKTPEEILTNCVKSLMDFFSEFAFTPSFRFLNTLVHAVHKSKEEATQFVCNYFKLMDNSYANEVCEKVKSQEFKGIMASLKNADETKTIINSRLKIYFGSAGCGKTTKAMTESDNRCVVCNATMLPSDLMEDFCFVNGQPSFNPSILWECMEQGKTIVLDEINLLPFDSLRFLQGICDGKAEFTYKNRPVHIADGFQIIGTMNLNLGGMAYPLPEPLVDRCAEIDEYKLTAEMLAKSIL